MAQLADIWHFTRDRLRQAFDGLTDEQLSWRPPGGGLTIFEHLFHVAGAEHYWAARLAGRDPQATELEAKLDRAVSSASSGDEECMFGPEEMTREVVEAALRHASDGLQPIIIGPSEAQLRMPLRSPSGDPVTGREGLIRVAQHAAYHTGQIWTVRFHEEFPKAA